MEIDFATMVVLVVWFSFVSIMMLVLWINRRKGSSSAFPVYESDTIESSDDAPLVAVTDKALCRKYFKMIDQHGFDKRVVDDRMRTFDLQKRWDTCRTDPVISQTLKIADEKGCLNARDDQEYITCLVTPK